jgi:hypothetical protein
MNLWLFISIRVRTEETDYSDLSDNVHDWTYSVYVKLEELLPADAPEPLGNYVTLSHYVDANLMHDIATGRSVTGMLHLVNKTSIEWYSKKQATVDLNVLLLESVLNKLLICTIHYNS